MKQYRIVKTDKGYVIEILASRWNTEEPTWRPYTELVSIDDTEGFPATGVAYYDSSDDAKDSITKLIENDIKNKERDSKIEMHNAYMVLEEMPINYIHNIN